MVGGCVIRKRCWTAFLCGTLQREIQWYWPQEQYPSRILIRKLGEESNLQHPHGIWSTSITQTPLGARICSEDTWGAASIQLHLQQQDVLTAVTRDLNTSAEVHVQEDRGFWGERLFFPLPFSYWNGSQRRVPEHLSKNQQLVTWCSSELCSGQEKWGRGCQECVKP